MMIIMMIIMIIMTCNNDDHHSPIPPHVPGSWNARSARCWILRYSSYNAVPWRGDLWYDSSHSILVPPLAWKFQEGSSLQFPRSSLPGFPLSAVVRQSSETWCTWNVEITLRKTNACAFPPFAVAEDVQVGILDVQHVRVVWVENLNRGENVDMKSRGTQNRRKNVDMSIEQQFRITFP